MHSAKANTDAPLTILATMISAVHLSALACLLQFLCVLSSEVTIDAASGEIVSPAENDDHLSQPFCVPNKLLDGQISTCTAYQITTLNASPRRCIHIEASPPIDEDEKPLVCTNYPNWSDGTNTCKVYAQARNKDWCTKFGGLDYSGLGVRHNANQACCVCGGGNFQKPRLQIGDYVKVKFGKYQKCEQMRIVEYNLDPSFSYVVEVTKECGRNVLTAVKNGVKEVKKEIQPGEKFHVQDDNPNLIEKHWKVELKKCRYGLAQQEFEFFTANEHLGDSDGVVRIQHKLSGVNLAEALGGKTNEVNITRVFEDGLFLGSSDFYYLQIITQLFEGRLNKDGTPWSGPPRSEYVASGYFGEKEYSEVKSSVNDIDDIQFSMWAFKQVEIESDETAGVVDEHAQWLLRMTQSIGVDYLDKLPPFHLLDVEREASKSEVKARFRELSKSFHPDKLVNQPEKKELFERIFVLLQNAYQGLKSADEAEKEKFRVQAESASQIFAHSQHVIELLPFHWTKIDDGTNETNGRYILNVASHINSTLLNVTDEVESDSTEQLWVTFMYSARCSMSRSVVGVVDLAARHLTQLGIKVGAYGCGLYKEFPIEKDDVLGVKSDPICSQFHRRETPNVHVIVETLPGKRRDVESGEFIIVPPDPEVVKDNAMFKYFYAAVPDGNSAQFLPQNFIDFAKAGRQVWESSHLVHKMRKEDFTSPDFISNISIVAFLDGTGLGETNEDVVSTISSSFPGLARRFVNDDVYVGISQCGFGDEYADENDAASKRYVDCSKLDVSRLPDIKIYAPNMTEGESLLRGQFGDRRDVQIALESLGNVIRMMIGGEDGDEVDLDEIDDIEEASDEGGGSCGNTQPPPPSNLDLDEIEGVEETPLLEMNSEEDTQAPPLAEAPKKPKLASPDKREKIDGGRDNKVRDRDRVAGFESRQQARRGGGKILGGGGGGGGGFISG
mmetsp:Transcript_5564/g.11734  ORF Transcript_5564/g.11734 Transcript_5564/m.11734 type:complete len:954 (-) Transcript_5564:86-2947(-)